MTTRSTWLAIGQILGWFGGLLACGVAWGAQRLLLSGNHSVLAGELYAVAILLLLTFLVSSRYRRMPVGTPSSDESMPAADHDNDGGSSRSPGSPLNDSNHPARSEVLTHPIVFWQRQRARYGCRAVAVGLACVVALTVAATVVLTGNVKDTRGGWLWVGAMVALFLTFAGAPPSRNHVPLLPGPDHTIPRENRWHGLGRLEAWLLAGILLVALLARTMNLEYMPGIFGDEGERGLDARAINGGNHAPLFGYGWYGVPNMYFYGLAWSLRLFGDSMTGVRMLSVISGLLAIVCVAAIGRLLWGPRVGVLAAALLAVSPLAIQFSRQATESTPTATLWIAGFLFLIRAMRYDRWVDWVVAGILLAFSLSLYASGKLIVPVLVLVVVYGLVRWRGEFVRRYGRGYVLLALAFGLAFLPSGIAASKDHWQSFLGRAGETSIFSPQNQSQVFARYHIPYDPVWSQQPIASSLVRHPVSWGRVLFAQTRVTFEVLYRHGDPTVFYQIREHGGSMLPPLWAALTLLGLAYAVWNAADARCGLTLLFFLGGMLGAILTTDAPSVQRLACAWPVIMLFPAVLLARICDVPWPVRPHLVRRWAAVPLSALIVAFGIGGFREYFVHYASLCPYCNYTLPARYSQMLGADYKAYQLGGGDANISFSYGSTRFVAKGVEGADLNAPAEMLPIIDSHGKGAAFLVFGPNGQYLPLIRLLYPDGTEQPVAGVDGVTRFTAYIVPAPVLTQAQSVGATYTLRDGQTITRFEPNLGTERMGVKSDGAWAPAVGAIYPFSVVWQGALIAPTYGPYRFWLNGTTDGVLDIDGTPVVTRVATDQSGNGGPGGVELTLARGIHDVRLKGTLTGATSRLGVLWARPNAQPSAIAADFLYHGPTGGLSGDIWPSPPDTPVGRLDVVPDRAPQLREVDPFLGFLDGSELLGAGPLIARWQGTLQIPTTGAYTFDTSANGSSVVDIDGKTVLNSIATSGPTTASASVPLTQGPHAVEVRYARHTGPARFEWYWTPPNESRSLVPPTVLWPRERSGAPPAVTILPPAAVPSPSTPAASTAPWVPRTMLGTRAGLTEARGIGVAANGNILVGDTGNHRILRLDSSGKVLQSWGTTGVKNGSNDFNLLADIAVATDGTTAAVDAGNGDVYLFAPNGSVRFHLPHIVTSASGIALGPDRTVWLADTAGSRIVHLGGDGQVLNIFTGGAEGSTIRLDQPVDVVVAPDGTLYAVDLRNRIVRLNAAGMITEEWPVDVGRQRGGSHLTLWQGKVVLSDPDRHYLMSLDPASGTMTMLGSEGTDPGQFRLPIGVATGVDGSLFVLDSGNGRIQVYSPTKT